MHFTNPKQNEEILKELREINRSISSINSTLIIATFLLTWAILANGCIS